MWHCKSEQSHCSAPSRWKESKTFQWAATFYRNVFYCSDACNVKSPSRLPASYIFNNAGSKQFQTKHLQCPAVLEVFFDSPIFDHTTYTCTHCVPRARKWANRSYRCRPQRHVYQLCAGHWSSDNTSWTLQRSLTASSQGHVSKAHSSSPPNQKRLKKPFAADLGNRAVLLSC